MILQALTAYYEEMLHKGKISAPGWDETFRVSFQLEIDDTGALVDVIDCREPATSGKKQVLLPCQMRVPAHKLRSSGISANFLCDNASYMLGADEKGKPERAKKCFEACAALHHALLDDVDTPAARAVLAFFDTWKPELAASHPLLQSRWKDVTGNANFVFSYDDASGRHPVTEDPELQAAWQRHYQAGNPDAPSAQCLITGKTAPIVATHPAIKGVRGAQSSGGSLVSFNASAYWSYGHEYSQNAPVSEYAAFAYTTALNALLADRNHCKVLGDTTVVCWAENAGSAYADLGTMALFGIPAVRGVEFGDGFSAAKLLGSAHNDAYCQKEGRVGTKTNHHGGVLGGITTGEPLVVRMAVKPTPSIARAQRTLDLSAGEEVALSIPGRHDPCIALRAAPVMEAVAAIVLLDLMQQKQWETNGR